MAERTIARTFTLEILTPDRQFYVGPAESLVMPIVDGLYGVEAGHAPEVTALEPGDLKFKVDGEWKVAVTTDGFAEVMPDYVILLASSVEWPDEIDEKRAEEAKLRAEERLRQKQSIQEYYQSKAALARATARLKKHHS